ncbi:hypothetical protein VitviT2T_007323 [Vitis vinifera]|uniref:PGG domain-containing protein n=2 Tax=Vitis vinifera TaxID=29760 RepID=A0ABY9BZ41_VITVI|nr:hypothetical protein VitviT2T_007323 [Vitis vinifera]
MGRTALHAAVIGNHLDITIKLLKWKPSLTKEVDEHGWSPLHCAAHFGYVKIVKQLLNKSLDKFPTYLRIKDGKKTALHIAAGRGHIDIVKLLVQHCPDCCEQVDCKGQNVFHFAMAKKKDDYPGKFLEIDGLKLRGLVNEKDYVKGDTPLHLLASYLVDDEDFIVDHTVDKMGLNSEYFTPNDIVSQATHNWVNKSYILHYLRKSKEGAVGPLSWLLGIREDHGCSESENKDEDRTRKKDDKIFFTLDKKAETHLIVAALITTVTFAAGFTVPGGYKEDKDSSPGTAVLAKKAAFKAFVVTDTIAMVLSISSVFVSFLMVYHKKQEIIGNCLLWGTLLTMFAMGAMVVAFMTGLYAVLPLSSGLPIANCVICCIFFIFFCYLFRQILKDED